MIQSNKRPFQNSKLHINSHVFWICIQASMTLRAGSSVLSQNWAPIPFTPTSPHQPPTDGIDYCTCPSISLYLQPTMPLLPMYLLPMPIVPVTDCTYYLLPATAPLVLHQPPRTNLFVTTGSSTGHRAAMQLNHARPCNYILNSTYSVFSDSK